MNAKNSPKEDLAAFLLIDSLNKKKPISSQKAMDDAGYTPKTAKSTCHKLKTHRFYKDWLKSRTDNAFASKEAIEKRLYRWLTANINDFFDFVDGDISIKDLKSLPREITNCIESIKKNRGGIEIKLVSKVSAMDMLCKINGLFVTKHEVSGKDGGPIMHYLGSDNLTKNVADKLCKPNNRIEGYVSEN